MTAPAPPSAPNWKSVLWTAAAILSLTALFVVVRDADAKRARLAASQQAAAVTQGWREVARWRGEGVMQTGPFTVGAPWRVRWQLNDAREPFRWMVLTGDQTESTLLLGEPGETVGMRVQESSGTYRLMLHNSVGYEVVVEEQDPLRGVSP